MRRAEDTPSLWQNAQSRYTDISKSLQDTLQSHMSNMNHASQPDFFEMLHKLHTTIPNEATKEIFDHEQAASTMGLRPEATHFIKLPFLSGNREESLENVMIGEGAADVAFALKSKRLSDYEDIIKAFRNSWVDDNQLGQDSQTAEKSDNGQDVLQERRDFAERASKLNYTLNLDDETPKCISQLWDLNRVKEGEKDIAERCFISYITSTAPLNGLFDKDKIKSLSDVDTSMKRCVRYLKDDPILKEHYATVVRLRREMNVGISEYQRSFEETMTRVGQELRSASNFLTDIKSEYESSNDIRVKTALKAFTAKSVLDARQFDLFEHRAIRKANQKSGVQDESTKMPKAERSFSTARAQLSHYEGFEDCHNLADLAGILEELDTIDDYEIQSQFDETQQGELDSRDVSSILVCC
ncbi:uncharacterized protein IL334_002279 [Kwoniella shivajii]|uniref:Uncharacterized protein n=1 Tax=Kwoniella shivajii TaxID=564305 RepID=A0ABZ1CUA6_9TREE|nr:hypothetical protein IL334_002279 [Kwoniella shivajii]